MINKDMTIMEALEENRAAATVFAGYGMGCIGCLAASGETIAEAATHHGIDVAEQIIICFHERVVKRTFLPDLQRIFQVGP